MDLTKQQIKEMIQMYRERKCLWHTTSVDYRKKDLRMRAYQEIVEVLKKHGVKEATDTLVRDKIQNMRRSVRKEQSKVEISNGAHKPSLWYYDLLVFVIDQNEKQKTVNKNESIKYETEESNQSFDETEYLSDDSKPDYVNLADEVNVDSVKSKPEKGESSKTPVKSLRQPNEYEALGINVGAKIRRMDSMQKIHAELLIQKVLAKGLLGQLTDTTDLVDVDTEKSSGVVDTTTYTRIDALQGY